MNKTKIKQTIQQLIWEGKTVGADWDCGGDEAIVQIHINGEVWDEPYGETSVSWQLGDLLIDILGLPSAGECYNKGEGLFHLNDQDQLVLHFSYNQYYVDYLEEKFPWTIKDPHRIRQHLSKANIDLIGGKDHFHLHTMIQQGDPIELPEEVTDAFKKQVIVLIEHLEEREPSQEKYHGQQAKGFYVQGTLTADEVVVFSVSKEYCFEENAENEQVIIID